MLMSVLDEISEFDLHPVLAGTRVLVTGGASPMGQAVLRALAVHRARIVVPDSAASAGNIRQTAATSGWAGSLTALDQPMATTTDATRVTQAASAVYGGLDNVITVVSIDRAEIASAVAGDDVSRLMTETLAAAMAVMRVAENRMSLSATPGAIVTILTFTGSLSTRESLCADLIRATLAGAVRNLATTAAAKGVRILAIADGRDGASDPTAAANQALRLLADNRGSLSGLVFELDACAGH
jgi:NAD(P)-dependent dehydrogenase (short-subunit alcohol dehydrogenase family)